MYALPGLPELAGGQLLSPQFSVFPLPVVRVVDPLGGLLPDCQSRRLVELCRLEQRGELQEAHAGAGVVADRKADHLGEHLEQGKT